MFSNEDDFFMHNEEFMDKVCLKNSMNKKDRNTK